MDSVVVNDRNLNFLMIGCRVEALQPLNFY